MELNNNILERNKRMPAYKNEKGLWYCSFYYKNWKGENKKKKKSSFSTKREALEWEQEFLAKSSDSLEMNFESFTKLYLKEMKGRIKYNTYLTKENIIQTKIIPYFKNFEISSIKPINIVRWQNELLEVKDDKGNNYSSTYLRSILSQLSAIFNHGVRFYALKQNPAVLAGSIGSKHAEKMKFWTQDEFNLFIQAVSDKTYSYEAFSLLYWTGIRVGELLALTLNDFDFEKNILDINKSYQRIKKQDIVTDPKTKKSIRKVYLPDSLAKDIKMLFTRFYNRNNNERIFQFTKGLLYNEMRRGCEASGVKRIRIHDLRHSHVSLLIEMGFTAVEISERLGHESIAITLRYAHMFPSKQQAMADKLNKEKNKNVQTEVTSRQNKK